MYLENILYICKKISPEGLLFFRIGNGFMPISF